MGIYQYKGRLLKNNGLYVGLDESTKLLINRMSIKPSSQRKLLIDKTIKDLKIYNLWDKLDIFYMFMSHNENESLLNWKSSSYTALVNNRSKLAYSNDTGWNATANENNGGYLNTQYNPNLGGTKYTLTSCVVGCLINSTGHTNGNMWGIRSGANASTQYATTMDYRLNDATWHVWTRTKNNSLFTVSRNGNSKTGYEDTTLKSNVTLTPTSFPSLNFYICSINYTDIGGAANSTTAQIGCWFSGSYFDSTDIQNINNIIYYYKNNK